MFNLFGGSCLTDVARLTGSLSASQEQHANAVQEAHDALHAT